MVGTQRDVIDTKSTPSHFMSVLGQATGLVPKRYRKLTFVAGLNRVPFRVSIAASLSPERRNVIQLLATSSLAS